MKTSLALSGLAAFLISVAPAAAQTTAVGEEKVDTANLVSAGRISAISEKNQGTMVLQPVGAAPPLMFVGMGRATIRRANGSPATFADLKVNSDATVYYAQAGKQLLVARVIIPDVEPVPQPVAPVIPAAPLTNTDARALQSPAARDNDITTEPGSKARIDNDITTVPEVNPRVDGDITTQPGQASPNTRDITKRSSEVSADRDGDITTREGNR